MKKTDDFQKIKGLKKEEKEVLFEKCWPGEKAGTPLLLIYDPTDHKMKELLLKLMEGLLVLPIKVIVVSSSEAPDLIKHPSGKISWVSREDGRNDPLIDKYLAASDMALLFEEHHNDVEKVLKKGVVVIGHEKSPLLENYHPNEETGNSFTFKANNQWDIFMALVRALETYKFPYDWDHMIRGMI